MPINFHIDETNSLKVVEIFGHAHLSELTNAAEQFLRDPSSKQVGKFYVDLTSLEDAKASFADVYKLCGVYRRELNGRGQLILVAIVAPTKLGLGISRMFSSIMAVSRVMKVKIFENSDTALDWLDVDGDGITDTLNRLNGTLEAPQLRSGLNLDNG